MTTSSKDLKDALRWTEERERDAKRRMLQVHICAFSWMFFILIDALTAGGKRDAVMILLAAVTGLVIGGAWVSLKESLRTVSEAARSIRTYVREAEEHERRFQFTPLAEQQPHQGFHQPPVLPLAADERGGSGGEPDARGVRPPGDPGVDGVV